MKKKGCAHARVAQLSDRRVHDSDAPISAQTHANFSHLLTSADIVAILMLMKFLSSYHPE